MLYSKKARSFIYDELPLDCKQMQYPWVGKIRVQKTASYRDSILTFFCVCGFQRWKKTCEEKDALSAMMKSMEKEGCKMARLLKVTTRHVMLKILILVSRVLQKIDGVSPASLGIRLFSLAAMKISCFSKKSFLKAVFPLMSLRPKKIRSPKRKTRPLLWSLITKF